MENPRIGSSTAERYIRGVAAKNTFQYKMSQIVITNRHPSQPMMLATWGAVFVLVATNSIDMLLNIVTLEVYYISINYLVRLGC